MKRKIFILFLMILTVFIFNPIVGYAETNKPDGAFWLVDEGTNHVWYKITDNTLTIGGIGDMKDWTNTNYSEQPWRDVGITDVVVENGITSIGVYSFYNISTISSVSFPNSLKTINTAAFYRCGLESVTFNEGLTEIGDGAFNGNSNLTEVYFPSTLGKIGTSAFQKNDIRDLVLPEGLTEIGISAFNNNVNLKQVILPSTLTSIGNQAFKTTSLETIISYNNIAPNLGTNVFADSSNQILSSIANVIIPYSAISNYQSQEKWLAVLNAENVSTSEAYIIKTNVTGKGTVTSSVKHILVNEYDSQKIDLIINPSTDSRLKSLAVLDEEEEEILVSNNSFTMPRSNVTIEAEFEIKKLNVTFNSNGGSEVNGQEITYGETITEPTDPTRTGYTFDGWYQDITLNVPFEFDTPITNEVTLYAKWTANEYKVTFDANEGTVTPSNKNVTFGSVYGELPVPTRTGYTFDGWYTAKDSGTEIKSDTTVAITNEQTLYAKWTANEYNIIITVNDEDMGTASVDLNKAIEGTKVSLTSLPKSGYHFVKWESEDVTITNNEFTMPAKNITIKAIFEEDEILTYRVSFDKNGGTGSMDDIAGLTGTYTLPKNNFVAPDGKQFKGWSLSSDGEIVEELNLDEDKIVYAIWEDIPEDYSYKFKKGDKQELTIDNIDSFTFTIDGDYSLFDSLKIGNLDLIKNEDYIVTEGSTIITFTNKGIAKLNTLEKGSYDILVTYSNGKDVAGSLSLNKILHQEPDTPNSKTGDKINYYIIIGITSLLGLVGSAFYVRKKLY